MKTVQTSTNAPRTRKTARILAGSIAAFLAVQSAQAATLYWDINGATANIAAPVTGTWDGANLFWNTVATGTGGTPQAGTTNADDLVFSSGSIYTTGTVTLSGARVASSVTFEDNIAVTLSGGTSLTLGGSGASSGIFVLSGDNAANTISTPIILDSGTAALTFSNAGTGLLTIGSVTGSAAGVQTISLTSTSSGGITLSGAIGNGGGGGTVALAVNNTSTGVTTLSGTNTYTGGTTLTAGTLTLGSTTALGATASALIINGGSLDSSVSNLVLANNNAQTWNGDFTFTGTQSLNLGAGAVSLGSTAGSRTVTVSANTLTVGGIISNGTATSLTKAGAGTLALNGANTFTGGVTLTAGTLRLGSTTALGTAAGALTIAGGSLDSSVGGLVLANNNAQTWNGDFAFTGTQSLNLGTGAVSLGSTAGSRTVTVSASTLTVGGIISDGTATGLTKAGVGTLALSGANTYTGATSVLSGVLNIQNANALGTVAAGTSVAAGAALQIQGGITTLAEALTLNGTGVANDGALRNLSGNNNYAGLITLGSATQINSDVGTLTISDAGTITGATFGLTVGGVGNTTINSIIGTTSGTLTKAGTGTLTLTGANTFSGATTVNGGMLTLTGTNAYTGATTINAGTLTLNRQTGSLSGTGALTFGGSGTFNMDNVGAGGALTQSFGALTFGGGDATVKTTRTAAFDQAITFASLAARTAGASANFVHANAPSATNGFVFTAAPATGQLTDRGLFYNGSSYAAYDATGTGFVRAYTAGDTNYLAVAGAGTMGTPATTDNVALSGNITAQTTVNGTVNTINMGANSITMSAAGQILSTNGLLSSGSTTATLGFAGTTAATTGVLQAKAAGDEIVIRVNGSTDKLTLNAIIQNFGAGVTASSLTKTGAGTLVLNDNSNNNTYTGNTFLNAGTVQLGSANAGSGTRNWFGTGTLTIADGASITTNSDPAKTVSNNVFLSGGYANLASRDIFFTGQISGPGGVAVIPFGRWVNLNNATNNFTGGIVMRGNGTNNTLRIFTTGSLSTGGIRVEGTNNFFATDGFKDLSIGAGIANAIELASGGSLEISSNSGPILLSGAITGGGSLSHFNSGTLALSGVNSYSGGTTVKAGVLTVSGSGTFGAATGNLTAQGGTLELNGNSFSAGTVNITGGIIQNGTLTGTSYAAQKGFVSANLAGSGALTMNQSGSRLVLSGTNTYSGSTTITAGTLRAISDVSLPNYASGTINVGASGTLQVTTGEWNTTEIFNLLNNPNLLFTSGGTFAIDTTNGDFSNSTTIDIVNLGLTKLGANTLTLTGTNSYTKTTTVDRGTLKIDAGAGATLSSLSPLTFSGTGTFNYDNTTASGATAQSLAALTFSAGEGTVQVTRTAAQTVGLTFSSLAARTAGATRNFVLGGTPGTNGTDSKIVFTAGATANAFIDHGTFFGGSAYAWYDAGNFVRAINYASDAGATTSGTTATLSSATHQQITGAITAQNTATFTTLNISGNNNFTLAAAQTVSVNGILKSGNTAGGAIITGGTGIQAISSGGELVVRTDGANDAVTISTPILGNGTSSLTKSGAGTLTFSSANTITAISNTIVNGVTLNAGTLNINHATALGGPMTSGGGNSNARFTINDGTTIDNMSGAALAMTLKYPMTWNGSFTFTGTNDLTFFDTSGNGNLTMPNDLTITVAAKTLNVQHNFVATSAALTKNGPGTLALGTNGGAGYSGGLTINNGVLTSVSAQPDGIAGTGPVTLGSATVGSDNAILSSGGTTTHSNPITVRAGSSGILALTAYANTATWAGPVILNNNLTVGGAGGVTLTSVISGSGGLLIGNAGTYITGVTTRALTNTATVVLFGNNTFTGDTVMVSNSGALQLSGLSVLKNSTLDTGTSGGQVVNFSVSGTNTYNLGGLKGADALAFGTNSISVGANGQSTAYTGALSGTGALIKTGTGTLNLSGTNTNSGLTTVNAGTLQFAKMASLYNNTPASWTAANINVKSGATLALNVDSAGTAGFNSANLNTLLTNISVAGSATAGLQAGATVAFDTGTATAGTFTQGNVIANSTGANGGAIGVTKLGSGTFVFDKANTYTGATTVSAGTLTLASTASLANTAMTVASGATLSVAGNVISTGTLSLNSGSLFTMSGDNALGTFTLGGAGTGLTLGGGNVPALTFDIGDLATGTDRIIVTNNVSAPSGGIITISQLAGLTSLTAGNYNLITSAGGFTGGGANGFTLSASSITVASVLYDLSLANSTSSNEILTVSLSAAPVAFWAGSADGIWNTAGGANWRTTVAGNVVTGVTPGATTNVTFVTTNPVAGNLTTSLGANITINSLTFNAAATTAVSIGGNTLTLNATGGSGIAVAGGSAAHTISSNVALGASQTWTVDNAAANALAVSGVVSDGGNIYGLTKAGTGTLTLSGANTYTGVTTVSAGTLQLAKTAALYNSNAANWTAAKINVKSGGTLGFNVGGTNEFTTGDVTTLLTNLAASASATNGMNAGSVLGFDTTNASGGNFTVADVIANTTGGSGGARGLTKLGTNTLTLTGTNTYTGATTISAGTLQLGSGGTTGSLSASSVLTNNGNFTINRSNVVAQGTHFSAAAITGTGSLTQAGAGTTTLSAANYTGVTTVSAGTLLFAKTAALYNNDPLSWTTTNINVASGGTLAFSVGVAGEFTAGDVTTLLTNLAESASPTDGMNPGAILGFDTSASGGSFTVADVIADTTGANGGLRSIVKLGSGNLTLTGTNTHTGGTMVNSGTFTLGNQSGGGTGSFTLAAGTTFQQETFEGNEVFGALPNAIVLSGIGNVIVNIPFSQKDIWLSQEVSGTGGFTVQGGSRALTLTANNTFSGGVRLTNANHRVQISDNNALGSGTFRSESAFNNSYLIPLTTLTTGGGVPNAFDIASGAYLNVNTTGDGGTVDLLLSGPISSAVGIGSLYKTGAGTLTLSGANTYTGTTTINAGTLQLGNGSTTGTLSTSSAITNNADFTINRSNAVLQGTDFSSAAITGTGSLTQAGAGTTTLTNANTFTGGTTVNNGTLVLNGANTGTGVIRGVATINSGGTLQLASANALGYNTGVRVETVNINGGTLEDVVNGDQGFNQTYNLTGGTMRANGGVSSAAASQWFAFGAGFGGTTAVNSFASATTSVIEGRIIFRNDNLNTNVDFTVADGAAATDLLVSAAITQNAGLAIGLTKAGAGVMQLTGANSYAGVSVINGGTLSISTSGNLGDASATNTIAINGGTLQDTGAGVNLGANRAVAIGAGGGTVDVAAASDLTISGAISGAGNTLTKTGAGTLTLSGLQTYGTLTTSAGTTNVDSALGSGTSTVNANATTNFSTSQTLAALNIGSGVEVTFGDGLPFAGGPDKFGAPALVPEPGTLGLLLVGALGLATRRRRRG